LAYRFYYKQSGSNAIRFARFIAVLLLLVPALPLRAAEQHIPQPPELQRDVDFWIRVYSEITTSEGFLHDEQDLSLVYRKLKFAPDVRPTDRRAAVDVERKQVEGMLKRLAAGAQDLSDDERQLANMFGPAATKGRYLEAARQVRFQLGQADRFRAGLERSSIWEAHIEETFAGLGLPSELAALPHVESSFDPTAYSKVGAAGLWQFMRSTGRLYMHVDDAVDERLDPFRATEAAARLLQDNFERLGSWPLALTAYNHGAAGMQRARDSMGTTDIATIVRNHKSRSFGFASRNFYVSFLAALTIDHNPHQYFGDLVQRPPMTFAEVEMPAFVPMPALLATIQLDKAELAALNPALKQSVWDGRQYVPQGYRLRLPAATPTLTSTTLAQRLDVKDQYINQPRSRSHRVKTGETLAAVAKKYGLSIATVAKLNGLKEETQLKARMTLRLPDVPATRISAVRSAVAVGKAVADSGMRQDQR
jgi:membrane-bound lytic murein transglycosylase D